jgi:hypothetical protein
MTVIGGRTAGTISDHVTLVRTITVEHTSDFILHEERTVVRVGADDVLDLTTTNIAHKIAS